MDGGYDGQNKRPVYVTVSFFHGTGAHFHVEMREQTDRNGDGRNRFMKFNRDETARRWIESTFQEEFSPETHRLVFRGDVNDTWYYPEGD